MEGGVIIVVVSGICLGLMAAVLVWAACGDCAKKKYRRMEEAPARPPPRESTYL